MSPTPFFSPIRLLLLLLAIALLLLSNAHAYPVPVRSSSLQARLHDERRLIAVEPRTSVDRNSFRARWNNRLPLSSWLDDREVSDKVGAVVKTAWATQIASQHAANVDVQSTGETPRKRSSTGKVLSSFIKPKSKQTGAEPVYLSPPASRPSSNALATKSPAETPSAAKLPKEVSTDSKPSNNVHAGADWQATPAASGIPAKDPAGGQLAADDTSANAPASVEPDNGTTPSTTSAPKTQAPTKSPQPQSSASEPASVKGESPAGPKNCKRGLVSLADLQFLHDAGLQKRVTEAASVRITVLVPRSLLGIVEELINLQARKPPRAPRPVPHATYDPVDPSAIYSHPEEPHRGALLPNEPPASASVQSNKQFTGADVNRAAFENLHPAGSRPHANYPKHGSGFKKGDPADPVPAGSTEISHWPILSGGGSTPGPTRGISYKPPGGGNHQIVVAFHDPNKAVGPRPKGGGKPPSTRPFTEAKPKFLPALICAP